LFAFSSILSLLTFSQPHRNQNSWIDYYNLKSKHVKRIASPDGRSRKVLVLTYNKDSVEEAIRNFEVIDNPDSLVIAAMRQAYALTGDSGKEHGFFVGRKGTITPIEEGTHFEMPGEALNRGKDFLKTRGDTSAYDVHTHEKYPPTGKEGDYGDASPSGDDQRAANFIGRTQASIVLGYVPAEHRDISPADRSTVNKTYTYDLIKAVRFYNSQKCIGERIEFESFIHIANEINRRK
jgi:hypothetical protein